MVSTRVIFSQRHTFLGSMLEPPDTSGLFISNVQGLDGADDSAGYEMHRMGVLFVMTS